MNRDIIVVVANAFRLRAIREASPFRCRALYFTDSNLVSAFESIRAHEPHVVALESEFAHTAEGQAFVERLQTGSMNGSEIHLISFANGRWSTSLPATALAPAAAPVTAVNTRRVPRFPVLDPLAVVVDGKRTSLVDMSVMGAQVVSTPALRPNQRLRIILPDEGDAVLRLTAHVAWSAFEIPRHAPVPFYRAGMEFTDAAAQALEAYCRRHCSGEPLLPR